MTSRWQQDQVFTERGVDLMTHRFTLQNLIQVLLPVSVDTWESYCPLDRVHLIQREFKGALTPDLWTAQPHQDRLRRVGLLPIADSGAVHMNQSFQDFKEVVDTVQGPPR